MKDVEISPEMMERNKEAIDRLGDAERARPRKESPRKPMARPNVCNRPGLGASKNDLSELHDEKMRNKRLRYHAKDKRGRPIFQTHRHRPTSGNEGHQNWPDDKFAGAHNNCATSLKYRKGS